MRLSRTDLEGALAFVREAGELESAEPFPAVLLERLVSLVRCRDASYCEIDRTRSVVSLNTGTSSDAPAPPEDVYWETLHEHPIRNHRVKTGELGAFKIYDFTTLRQLRRTQFYSDFVRPWATPFMMTLGLPTPPSTTRTFIFTREARDFGERERALLDVLQPHLAKVAHTSAVQRRTHGGDGSSREDALTKRETVILAHVAKGLRNREIAAELWISPGTVRRHLDNIYAKLDVHTRTAAIRIARERGSIPPRTFERS